MGHSKTTLRLVCFSAILNCTSTQKDAIQLVNKEAFVFQYWTYFSPKKIYGIWKKCLLWTRWFEKFLILPWNFATTIDPIWFSECNWASKGRNSCVLEFKAKTITITYSFTNSFTNTFLPCFHNVHLPSLPNSLANFFIVRVGNTIIVMQKENFKRAIKNCSLCNACTILLYIEVP